MVFDYFPQLSFDICLTTRVDYFDIIPQLENTFKTRFYIYDDIGGKSVLTCCKHNLYDVNSNTAKWLDYCKTKKINLDYYEIDEPDAENRYGFWNYRENKYTLVNSDTSLYDIFSKDPSSLRPTKIDEPNDILDINIDVTKILSFLTDQCGLHIHPEKTGWYYGMVCQ